MKLYELAHARAGDKGNTLTLALIPYREEDYELLRASVTAERVQNHLIKSVSGAITRYELPNVHSLLFVCQDALSGGVTTSLRSDPHGKSMSGVLLDMEL